MGLNDSTPADGGNSQQTETPKTPVAGSPATDSPTSSEPASTGLSVIGRITALAKDKTSLQAGNNDLSAQVKTLTEQLATANATVAEQAEELVTLRQFKTDLEASVEQLEKDRVTVSAGIIDGMSALGVPAESLPGTSAKEEETLEQVQQQMTATKDPVEKGRLAAKARELRWA